MALNAPLLLAGGLAFHALTRHRYPHPSVAAPAPAHGTADMPASARVGVTAEDLDAVLRAPGEVIDIGRDNLAELIEQTEQRAWARRTHGLCVADIMSRDW